MLTTTDMMAVHGFYWVSRIRQICKNCRNGALADVAGQVAEVCVQLQMTYTQVPPDVQWSALHRAGTAGWPANYELEI